MAYLRGTNQSLLYEGLALYPYGSIPREILETGNFEPASGQFLMSRMPSDGVFIDIGANVGLFSLLLARRHSGGRILAIEPTTQTYRVLERNIRLNSCENIEPCRVALTHYDGEGDLFLNQNGREGLNCLAQPVHSAARVVGTERIPVRRLDTLLKERGISHVDLIKIDVEGAELLVLQGAGDLLNRADAPTILFENGGLSLGFGYGPEETSAFLRGCGYAVSEAPGMPDMWVAEKPGSGKSVGRGIVQREL